VVVDETMLSAGVGTSPAAERGVVWTNAFHMTADASNTTTAEINTSMRRSSMRAICERAASCR
jgi:hypothetical protein